MTDIYVHICISSERSFCDLFACVSCFVGLLRAPTGACKGMPARPKNKKKPGSCNLFFLGASIGEVQQLASLLPLLRSGALQTLLNVSDAPKPPKQERTKKKDTADAVEPGWKIMKPKEKKTPEPAAESVAPSVPRGAKTAQSAASLAADTLLPEGFSCEGHAVKVLQSVAEIKVDVASVCLATRQEALKAELEINAQVPIALLIPSSLGEGCQLLHVAVKDHVGRVQVRRRFLFQLGKKPIRYMEDAPQGGKVNVETEKIVLGVMKKISPCWDAALQNPKRIFGNWLRDVVGISSVVEIQRPNLIGDKLQAVVVLRKGERDLCLRASGKGDGVFSRVFVEKDVEQAAAEFRTAPVPIGQDLASALRTAESLQQHWGIVPYGKGVGIRVAANDFEATLAVVQPMKEAVKFVGDMFSVSGVPLSWSTEDLSTFFEGKWTMSPIFSKRVGFTKTWTVRASAAPLHSHWQHDFGLATVCKKGSTEVSGRGGRNNETEQRLVWNGNAATLKATQPARQPQMQRQQPRQQQQQQQQPPKQPAQQAPQPERQQPQRQPENSSPTISAEVLQAIQAAVSAAIRPLQQEVEQMKAAYAGDATESELEEDDVQLSMQVDARLKRSLDSENSNGSQIRKPEKGVDRPSRMPRKGE